MDDTTGRFISPDPVRPVDASTSQTNFELLVNPQRLNQYAYGMNNPYRYVDLDGNYPTAVALSPLIVTPIPGARIVYGAAVVGSTIYAGYKTYKSWQYLNESNENSSTPDFVGQPNGGRTDVLQKEDHGAGQSHTHNPIVNVDKKTGKRYVNGKTKPGRAVSASDVKNIKNGDAKRTKPKKR